MSGGGARRTVSAEHAQQWSKLSSTRCLELASISNNRGITARDDLASGAFNVWGNSFPAEEMPLPGHPARVDGIPFVVGGDGCGDNVRCEGQFLPVPAGRYDWLYLLAAGERRVEDELTLCFGDGSLDFEPVRVSDFWDSGPAFGETCAVATRAMHYPHHVQAGVSARLWCQRVPVTRRAALTGIVFPHNVALHVFAATLVGAGG